MCRSLLGLVVASCPSIALASAGATSPDRAVPAALRLAVMRTLAADEVAKLTASDGGPEELFGVAVHISGDTALVSAKNATVNGNEEQGAAYVFVRSGDTWSEQGKLIASDGAAGDLFGGDIVAIDGDTALIGAWKAEVDGREDQGAAYVFVREAGVWSEQAKLISSDGMAEDSFGVAVALDGDTALIGANNADVDGTVDQGAAYVFVRDGDTWSEQAKLTASDGLEGDRFGLFRSALDGDTAVIGAWEADVDGAPDQGSAYVFTRSGETWSEVTRLLASDGSAGNAFGTSTALEADTVIVGAPGATVNGNPAQGAAYVYVLDGGVWAEQQKLTAADGAPVNLLGASVDLSGDTALVGAPFATVDGKPQQGAAYLFTRVAGVWGEQDKLTASDGAGGDTAALSVALEGETALVGASGATVDGNALQGAAYVFDIGDPGSVELAFDPASLDFGEVEIGTTGGPLTATLHNSGTLDATEIEFDLSEGDFVADTGDCGDTLAAGGSCDVAITFTPTEIGSAAASLEVTSFEGAAALLSLSGVGSGVAIFTPVEMIVDPSAIESNGNGVFEPAESVDVIPFWRNDGIVGAALTGTASDFAGPQGAIYSLDESSSEYGFVEPDDAASCVDSGICYRLGLDDPELRPAAHWDAEFIETLDDAKAATQTWTLHVGASFTDVPAVNLFYSSIETLLHHGVTGGCIASGSGADSASSLGAEAAGLRAGRHPGRDGARPLQAGGAAYCPSGVNSRSQMPVFMLRALEGPDYTPPPCFEDDEPFADVPFDSPFCPWIQELADRGIVAGCGNGDYCPGSPVTRVQMSIFLLKTLLGTDYTPPTCTNRFDDVTCPSLFADWIEDLAARGITGGCSATEYCPEVSVSRAQMAAFVTKAFGLTLYGP